MSTATRLDLPRGRVPDYRTFVRHLWSYRDPHGFQIWAPPVMYRAIFEDVEDGDSDWEAIRDIASNLVIEFQLDDHIQWQSNGPRSWELQFRSLKSLHMFCVSLGDRARVQEDEAAIRVGEFIMWTLGFRWI